MDTDPSLEVAPAPAGWHRFTTSGSHADAGVVVYGTAVPTEADAKLLGSVEGKRVLDLGCGTGHNAVVLAQQGAKVIAVDPSNRQLAAARTRCDEADVRVELHQGALADLAFVRSDSIDAALSVMALATTDDLARTFRQVHRVLKPEAPLACSFPHPAFAMFDPSSPDPLRAQRAYGDPTPQRWEVDDEDVTDHPRTIAEIFTTFSRAGFRVDLIFEPTAGPGRTPEADLMRAVPPTLLLRARKQGN